MKYIVPELLDDIKAKYEDDLDKPASMYKLVLLSGDDGFITEVGHVLEYEDLCGRLFDLDVFGWEVIGIKDSMECFHISPNETKEFILVTINLYRKS